MSSSLPKNLNNSVTNIQIKSARSRFITLPELVAQ